MIHKCTTYLNRFTIGWRRQLLFVSCSENQKYYLSVLKNTRYFQTRTCKIPVIKLKENKQFSRANTESITSCDVQSQVLLDLPSQCSHIKYVVKQGFTWLCAVRGRALTTNKYSVAELFSHKMCTVSLPRFT